MLMLVMPMLLPEQYLRSGCFASELYLLWIVTRPNDVNMTQS